MDSVAVVLAGDFRTDTATPGQVRSLIRIVTYLQKKYEITNENVIAHQEGNSTSCPGDNIMAILSHYREKHLDNMMTK